MCRLERDSGQAWTPILCWPLWTELERAEIPILCWPFWTELKRAGIPILYWRPWVGSRLVRVPILRQQLWIGSRPASEWSLLCVPLCRWLQWCPRAMAATAHPRGRASVGAALLQLWPVALVRCAPR